MSEPIEIPTPWGSVTEAARLQAAINMRVLPELREKVIGALEKKLGSRELAEAEAHRVYPEAFVDDAPKA